MSDILLHYSALKWWSTRSWAFRPKLGVDTRQKNCKRTTKPLAAYHLDKPAKWPGRPLLDGNRTKALILFRCFQLSGPLPPLPLPLQFPHLLKSVLVSYHRINWVMGMFSFSSNRARSLPAQPTFSCLTSLQSQQGWEITQLKRNFLPGDPHLRLAVDQAHRHRPLGHAHAFMCHVQIVLLVEHPSPQ